LELSFVSWVREIKIREIFVSVFKVSGRDYSFRRITSVPTPATTTQYPSDRVVFLLKKIIMVGFFGF
jgi:hypothetical protein